jgi:hypothetical protein
VDDEFTTTRHKPSKPGVRPEVEFASPDQGRYQLVFDIREMILEDHPYMNDEARVSKEMTHLIEMLAERRRSNLMEYLDNKILVQKRAYEEHKLANGVQQSLGSSEDLPENQVPAVAKAQQKLHPELDSQEAEMRNLEKCKRLVSQIMEVRLLRVGTLYG